MKKRSIISLVALVAVAVAVAVAVIALTTDVFGDEEETNQVALGPVPQAELDPPASSGPSALTSGTPEVGGDPGSIPSGCLVPDVRGKPLGIAVAALRIYECAPGKITQARSTSVRKGYVIAQSAAPGKQLQARAKIRLTVSGGPRA